MNSKKKKKKKKKKTRMRIMNTPRMFAIVQYLSNSKFIEWFSKNPLKFRDTK